MPGTPYASKASVRLALPSELPAITHVVTRAFARDPGMNWFGSVKNMVPDHKSTLPSSIKTMERLSHLMLCLCKATLVAGGIITVVVVPREAKVNSMEESSKETIVAVNLWLKPGQKLGGPVWNIVRIRPQKLLLGWGWQGLKRMFFDFKPKIERTLKESFQSRDLKPIDSWHLLLVAVDPDYEGRGYCSMLMKEGFTRTSPYPVHLEASTAKSRNIYAHFNFEVDGECQFGKGQADANGLVAKGGEAIGFTEWVMTKWTY